MVQSSKKKLEEWQTEIQWFLNFATTKDFSKLSEKRRLQIAGVIQKHIQHQRIGDIERSGLQPVRPEIMIHLKTLTDPIPIEKVPGKDITLYRVPNDTLRKCD